MHDTGKAEKKTRTTLVIACALAVAFFSTRTAEAGVAPTKDESRELQAIKREATALKATSKRRNSNVQTSDVELLENRLGELRRFAVHNPLYESAAAAVRDLRDTLGVEFTESIPDVEPYTVRVAYLVPSNRDPSPLVIHRAAMMLTWYEKWFTDEMDRHGFGPMTFRFETRPNGHWPVVHPVRLARPDNYYRGTAGNKATLNKRVNEDAANAGVPIDAAGQIWWLLVDMQEMQPDGSFLGTHRQGGVRSRDRFVGGTVCDIGILTAMSSEALRDTRNYDGIQVPSIGPHRLRYTKSFDASRGKTVSEIASATAGSFLHEIGHSFGLLHDFRNDDVKAGNVMGLGLRGFRGWVDPRKFRTSHARLTANDAAILRLSRFFRAPQQYSDSEPPRLVGAKMGETPKRGQIVYRFKASDNEQLAYAALVVGTTCVGETTLEGKQAEAEIHFDRFNFGEQAWQLRLFDAAGNQRRVANQTTFRESPNRAPQPFVACPATTVKVGQRITVSALKTSDPDGDTNLLFAWDQYGAMEFSKDSTDPQFHLRYNKPGFYQVTCRVTDSAGGIATSAPIAIQVER